MTAQEYLERRDLHPFWDISRDPNKEDVLDAFVQGKAEGVKEILSKACKEIDIIQWYIVSVDAHEPIWTDEHIKELCKDYILIRKKTINN